MVRVALAITAILLLLSPCFSQRGPAQLLVEEPQCATKCCGPEPAIPSDFKIIVADYSRVLKKNAKRISKRKAIKKSTLPYLHPDQIEHLASVSDAYFRGPEFSSAPLVSSNQCEIPIELACAFKYCGCPPELGRRLLQCLPFFSTCTSSSTSKIVQAPIQLLDDPSQARSEPEPIPLPSAPSGPPENVRLVVGLCQKAQCILFRIKKGKDVIIEDAAGQSCPNRRSMTSDEKKKPSPDKGP